MGDFALRYRPGASPDDLGLNECCIRRTVDGDGTQRGWGMWFVVARQDNGAQELLRVQVMPNGNYVEQGPGGRRTWGLRRVDGGTWQVSPSINYTGVWHKTPTVEGVPAGEPWQ